MSIVPATMPDHGQWPNFIRGWCAYGMETSIGAVAPGYYADIVAVQGDPLADIDAVVNGVRWVMKSDVVVVDKIEERR